MLYYYYYFVKSFLIRMDGVEEQLDNKRMFLVKSCPTAVAVFFYSCVASWVHSTLSSCKGPSRIYCIDFCALSGVCGLGQQPPDRQWMVCYTGVGGL